MILTNVKTVLLVLFAVGTHPGPSTQNAPQQPGEVHGADENLDAARTLLAKAAEHENMTSWSQAVEYYSQALKLFPEYQTARFGMGRCYEHLKKTDEAVQNYRIVANSPSTSEDLAQAVRSRIEALMIPRLSQVQEESYDIARGLLDRARQLEQESQTDPRILPKYTQASEDVIARLEHLRGEAAGFTPLYWDLALAYELAGRNKDADNALDDYLKQFNRLEIPYGSMQKAVRARRAILASKVVKNETEVSRLSVEQASRLYSIGVEAEACGAYEQAVEAYNIVLRYFPDNYQASYHAGLCHYAQGHDSEAIKNWRRAAWGKNTPETLVDSTCNLIEKAASQKLSKDQEARLSNAIYHYEAAEDLFARGHLVAQGDWGLFIVEDNLSIDEEYKLEHLRRRRRTQAVYNVINKQEGVARSELEALAKEAPGHTPIYYHLGKTWQLGLELTHGDKFAEAPRLSGRDALLNYINWYKSLDLPHSAKFKDASRRYHQLWTTW